MIAFLGFICLCLGVWWAAYKWPAASQAEFGKGAIVIIALIAIVAFLLEAVLQGRLPVSY